MTLRQNVIRFGKNIAEFCNEINKHNNFPQSGPALQGCTVNVPVPKAVSS